MSAGPLVVRRSIAIDAPTSTVWDIITSPKLWSQWMMVPPAPQTGETIQLGSKVLWRNEEGEVYLTGTVATWEPGSRFLLELDDVSWKRKAEAGAVTYGLTISQEQHHTRVDFRLGDLAIDPDGTGWYEAYANSRELERIKAA